MYLHPERAFIVYSGDEVYPITEDINAIGLVGLTQLIQDQN